MIKKTKFMKLSFTVNGTPIPTKRPRLGKYGNMYVPGAKKNHRAIQKQVKEQVDMTQFEIISGEIHLFMDVFVEIPLGFSKTDKLLAEEGLIKPTTLPDLDNYLKTYMDGLNKFIWLDDGQVTETHLRKFYSNNPRVEITLKYTNDIHCSVLNNYAKSKKTTYELGK